MQRDKSVNKLMSSEFLTSILSDKDGDMLLTGLPQSFHEVVTLVFWHQQIQHGVVSLVHRSLTANLGQLSASQHLTAEKFIQQPKVWINDIRQSRL